MFFNYKTSDVGFYYEDDKLVHKSLNIEPIESDSFGCPSISSFKKRYYEIYPQFSCVIDFGLVDNEPKYFYTLDKSMNTTDYVHDLIKSKVNVRMHNNKIVLQITDNKLFVTDDKNLEMLVFRPDNINYENASFVNGSFNPYGWIRSLNAAYVQDDVNNLSKITINMDEPYFNLLFNKKINLKEIIPSKKITDYAEYSLGMVNYHRNLQNVMNKIIKKRPFKLL